MEWGREMGIILQSVLKKDVEVPDKEDIATERHEDNDVLFNACDAY